jgi:hypothetical protein
MNFALYFLLYAQSRYLEDKWHHYKKNPISQPQNSVAKLQFLVAKLICDRIGDQPRVAAKTQLLKPFVTIDSSCH